MPSLPLLIGGVAAILLGTSGFAAVTAWMPAATNETGIASATEELATPVAGGLGAQAPLVPAQREGDTRLTVKCPECGVIASTREMRRLPAGIDRYEVTVRMNDGSSRVFTDPNPTTWRPGQRVILLESEGQAND